MDIEEKKPVKEEAVVKEQLAESGTDTDEDGAIIQKVVEQRKIAQQPKGNRTKVGPKPGSVSLKMLIDAGLIKPGQEALLVEYKGTITKVDLTSQGTMVVNLSNGQSKEFDSPSACAVFVKRLYTPSRKADDGWKSLKYEGKAIEYYKKLLHPKSDNYGDAAGGEMTDILDNINMNENTKLQALERRQRRENRMIAKAIANFAASEPTNQNYESALSNLVSAPVVKRQKTEHESTLQQQQQQSQQQQQQQQQQYQDHKVVGVQKLSIGQSQVSDTGSNKQNSYIQPIQLWQPQKYEYHTNEQNMGNQRVEMDVDFTDDKQHLQQQQQQQDNNNNNQKQKKRRKRNYSDQDEEYHGSMEQNLTEDSDEGDKLYIQRRGPLDHTANNNIENGSNGENNSNGRPKRSARSKNSVQENSSPDKSHAMVYCEHYTGGKHQQPFRIYVDPCVEMHMDFHAHLSYSEVIGLLGGTWDEQNKSITIEEAQPVQSLRTDDDSINAEMDPVDQQRVTEDLHKRGYKIVGWYHSHPAFQASPSMIDIREQVNQQQWHRTPAGDEPYVAIIVGPNLRNSNSVTSDITYFWVEYDPSINLSKQDDPLESGCVPMQLKVDILKDRTVKPSTILHYMSKLKLQYIGTENATELTGLWRDRYSMLYKIMKSTGSRFPCTWDNKQKEEFMSGIKSIVETDQIQIIEEENT